MDVVEGVCAPLGQLEHGLIVVREGVGVAPGQQHQLAVAVDAVVEDPVLLPGHDVAADVDILHLRPGKGAVVSVTAPVIGAATLVPVMTIVPIGVNSLSR